jgi:cystathionine beta-lyase/cystathionine gamma-synthase
LNAPWIADLLEPAGGRPAGPAAEWEGAESSVAYRSRADAVRAVLTGLTNPGGHIIAGCPVGALTDAGRSVSVVPPEDPDAIIAEVRDTTQLVFLPSVAEPSMRLVPVNDIGAIAHGENLILVVDNSILTPALFRPMDCGAHVVIEDWTEHGAPVCTVAGDRRLLRLLPPGEPDIALPAGLLDRIRRCTAVASAVAATLSGHRMVTRVRRPDVTEHPWARETHEGFGPVLVLTCATDPARVAAALTGTGLTATPLESGAVRVTVAAADPERITAAVAGALDRLEPTG